MELNIRTLSYCIISNHWNWSNSPQETIPHTMGEARRLHFETLAISATPLDWDKMNVDKKNIFTSL